MTRLIQEGFNEEMYNKIKSMTMENLGISFIIEWRRIKAIRDGLTSEVIAGVNKTYE